MDGFSAAVSKLPSRQICSGAMNIDTPLMAAGRCPTPTAPPALSTASRSSPWFKHSPRNWFTSSTGCAERLASRFSDPGPEQNSGPSLLWRRCAQRLLHDRIKRRLIGGKSRRDPGLLRRADRRAERMPLRDAALHEVGRVARKHYRDHPAGSELPARNIPVENALLSSECTTR